MNYFKVLSYVLGIIMILTRPAMHIFPKAWNKFELEVAYKEKQPKWIWIVAFIGLLLVVFTWYMHFISDVSNSIIITIFISLTLIKTSQVLFNYNKFRNFVTYALVENREVLNRINLLVLIFGILLILLGYYIY